MEAAAELKKGCDLLGRVQSPAPCINPGEADGDFAQEQLAPPRPEPGQSVRAVN